MQSLQRFRGGSSLRRPATLLLRPALTSNVGSQWTPTPVSRTGFASRSLKKYKNFDLYESKADEGDTTIAKKQGVGVHPQLKAQAARAARREDDDGDDEELSKLSSERQSPILYQRMIEILHPPRKPIEDRRPEDIEQDRKFLQWYMDTAGAHQNLIFKHLDRRLKHQHMAVNALPPRWRRLAMMPDRSVWHKDIPAPEEQPPWWMAKGRMPNETALSNIGEDAEFFRNKQAAANAEA